MSWPTDLICSILPPGIEFPPSMAADLAGVECRLTFRSSTVDGRSRNGFRWPSSGWTDRVVADPSDVDCSYGLHAAGSGGHRSCMGFGSGRRGELVAVPVDEIVHDSDKLRFGRAYVVDVFDLPGLIRAGHFAGADLTGVNLYGANLDGANLDGAILTGADLDGADLDGAILTGANLYGADLRGADLRGANLYGADLAGAILYGANLYGANLAGANLRGANLRGANLRGAYLTGANLDGANLDGATLDGADLTGANLAGANLRRAYLVGANLRGAYIDGANLSGATAGRRTVWPDGFDVDAAGVVTT